MKHPHLLVSSLVVLYALIGSALGAEVKTIDFQVEGNTSVIKITTDSPVEYEKTENAQDSQIVFNFKDTKLDDMASRQLDTSSFNSPVSLISPYQMDDEGGSRVVVQLRNMITPEVTQNGNVLEVRIPNDGTYQAEAPTAEPSPEPGAEAAPLEAEAPAESPAETGVSAEAPLPPPEVPQSVEPPKDALGQFLESRETKNFRGTPINLQVRDADVRDILRLVAEASGFNIIVGPDVQGTISLSLVDVPWDQALDVVLQTLKLGAERNNNVLRVVTLDNLTAEKQQELTAKKAAELSAPRVTKIFPISYANIDDLATLLKTFGASGVQEKATASVQVDKRTNSIVVQDVVENIDRMSKLIQILDTQTPQVLIEAKVVEASEGFKQDLGGGLALGKGGTQPWQVAVNGSRVFDKDGGLAGSTYGIGDLSKGGVAVGLTPTNFLVPGLNLDAFLGIAETEKKLKVISSPKTVVLNKETAKILQTTPVAFNQASIVDGQQVYTTILLEANLSLDVTPTITNDEGVLMQLNISRDVPIQLGTKEGVAVGKRNITSKVLVQSGETLVIGGIYTMDQTESESGVPFLKDIPILGWLFGTEASNTERTELFVFISPKIINIKRAGLSG